ncbi:hypothetical protein PGTUg99_034007 [Puccinia graminis f. sp. tritici]|uniref:Uncharacterized protein n=1 Tax=Puccinia graminis f. sp. tritici TaxID=56615 RepID=A0A5B0LXM1_PUCGR|nr:hypothetical protein PGTUg99_034007 [Puccinia graminis f. sp. tritici]
MGQFVREVKYKEVGAIGNRSGVKAADLCPGCKPRLVEGVKLLPSKLNSFHLSRFPFRKLLERLIGPCGSTACQPNIPIFKSPKSVSFRCPQ